MKLDNKHAILFVLPSLILFTFVVIIPFVMGVNIAFTNWDGISTTYDYTGLKNFRLIFQDSGLLRPIRNTLYFAVCYTLSNNVLALTLAVLLNRWIAGRNALKVVFFVPMALSAVLSAFVWSFIYKDLLKELFGMKSLLGSPNTVIPGIIILALWNTIGSNLIIYMAGLTNIPEMYMEASEIDGASRWQQFRHVTLPMLAPAFTICVTLTFTSSLREFANVMSATGGGPAGYSETISIYIYKNLFSFQKAGYGQAVALLFMLILVVIGSSMSLIFRKREVEY